MKESTLHLSTLLIGSHISFVPYLPFILAPILHLPTLVFLVVVVFIVELQIAS